MILEEKGIIYSEEYIATALKTTEEGARILDIPQALKNLRRSEVPVVIKKDIKFVELEKIMNEGHIAIASVYTNNGLHAVLIDAIENGMVILRDPLPIQVGSSYSLGVFDFEKLFYKRAVIFKK